MTTSFSISTVSDDYRKKLENRFWDKVLVKNDKICWNWKASLDSMGRGQIMIYWLGKQKKMISSRVSYQLIFGDIPNNLCVLHKCDNPKMEDCRMKNRESRGSKHPVSKLKEKDVLLIRRLSLKGIKQNKLSKRFNTCKSTISLIVNYKRWKWLKEGEMS